MQTKTYNLLEVASGKPIKLWTQGVPVEEDAKQQLMNTAKMPFIFKHLAVMPDVHLGKGSTIGSVIPTVGAIIPAAVGVDIGCGMIAARTSMMASDLPDNLHGLRHLGHVR
jgi:tRNA-splicing ligase RtcB